MFTFIRVNTILNVKCSFFEAEKCLCPGKLCFLGKMIFFKSYFCIFFYKERQFCEFGDFIKKITWKHIWKYFKLNAKFGFGAVNMNFARSMRRNLQVLSRITYYGCLKIIHWTIESLVPKSSFKSSICTIEICYR